MRALLRYEHGPERFQCGLKRGDRAIVRGADAAFEELYRSRVHP